MDQITKIFLPDEKGRRILQKKVAEDLGVDVTAVNRWARGKSFPSARNIEKLIQLGYLDVEDLKKPSKVTSKS